MYNQRRRHLYDDYTGNKTKVSFTWNALIGAYDLKFQDTKNWSDIQGVITFVKGTIPAHERDYDSVTKVWGIPEQYFENISLLLKGINKFDVNIIEKPKGSTSQATFVPVSKFITTFESLTEAKLQESNGNWIKYDEAKRIYRRACLSLHPDRNPNDFSMASKMSQLNQAWTELEIRHFKVREVAGQQV